MSLAALPFIVDDAIVGLAQPPTETLDQLANGLRRAGNLIEERHLLSSARGIVSVFRVDTTWRCTSCSKNEEHGEEDAEDDDRNFSFSKHFGSPLRQVCLQWAGYDQGLSGGLIRAAANVLRLRLPPNVLEPPRSQRGIARGRVDRPMAEIGLQRSGIDGLVGQRVAAGMP